LQIVDNMQFCDPMCGMSAALHPTIALLQSNSLASVVQQEIERAILAGEYAPGSKLLEAALAEKMGVSRGPVREAFRVLDEAGLVRTEKNRGVFVRDIPIDEAIEIFDLRAAMDEWVGRRLAEQHHSTPAQGTARACGCHDPGRENARSLRVPHAQPEVSRPPG
jgi:DNA-binding GntR family transcriptional regulator